MQTKLGQHHIWFHFQRKSRDMSWPIIVIPFRRTWHHHHELRDQSLTQKQLDLLLKLNAKKSLSAYLRQFTVWCFRSVYMNIAKIQPISSKFIITPPTHTHTQTRTHPLLHFSLILWHGIQRICEDYWSFPGKCTTPKKVKYEPVSLDTRIMLTSWICYIGLGKE